MYEFDCIVNFIINRRITIIYALVVYKMHEIYMYIYIYKSFALLHSICSATLTFKCYKVYLYSTLIHVSSPNAVIVAKNALILSRSRQRQKCRYRERNNLKNLESLLFFNKPPVVELGK